MSVEVILESLERFAVQYWWVLSLLGSASLLWVPTKSLIRFIVKLSLGDSIVSEFMSRARRLTDTSLLRPTGRPAADRNDPTRSIRRHGVRVSPAEIRSLGRIPLEHNYGVSKILDFCISARLARLRPSSAKPAFAITHWELIRSAEQTRLRGEFSPGGYRVSVIPHLTESPRHLVKSMRSGFRTWMRTVVICTPEDLLYRDRPVRCFTVLAPPLSRSVRREYPKVTVNSTDPLASSHAHDVYRFPNDVPRNAIWLVDVRDEDGSARVEWPDPLSDHKDQFDSGLNRGRRWFAYVMLVSVLIALTILIGWQVPNAEPTSSTSSVNLGAVESAVDPGIYSWMIDERSEELLADPESADSAVDDETGSLGNIVLQILLIIEFLVWALIFYGLVGFIVWDIRYWIFENQESWSKKAMKRWEDASVDGSVPELPRCRAWIASTTRCLSDGDRIRNGIVTPDR